MVFLSYWLFHVAALISSHDFPFIGDVALKGFTTVVNRGTVLRIELRVPSCNGAYYSQNQNPIIVGQTIIGNNSTVHFLSYLSGSPHTRFI